MPKEIWLGPLLGNNRSRLIERCAGLVSQNKTNSFLYLAASHPLLEIVTQAFSTAIEIAVFGANCPSISFAVLSGECCRPL